MFTLDYCARLNLALDCCAILRLALDYCARLCFVLLHNTMPLPLPPRKTTPRPKPLPKCKAKLRREKNIVKLCKMALDLVIIQEKKSKQPAAMAERKALALETLLPNRRSGREKNPVKYFNS